ncbi:MAG: metallopeptidase TldD-related protein [Acidobacteriota bacterium]
MNKRITMKSIGKFMPFAGPFATRTLTARAAALAVGVTASAALLLSQAPAAGQTKQATPNQAKQAAIPADEILFRAMRDEMGRTMGELKTVDPQNPPYYVSYTVSDSDSYHVASTMGATISGSRNRSRTPIIEVRVGSYDSDNTNHTNTGAFSGTRFDGSWPLGDDYKTLRDGFWLASDRAFKTALESMSRKKASQNSNAVPSEAVPDFAHIAAPVVKIPKLSFHPIDEAAWNARSNRLSAIFTKYPEIIASSVEIQVIDGYTSFMSSEGTAVRYDDGISWLTSRAEGQAPDGMIVHDAASIQTLGMADFPTDAELSKSITGLADNVKALMKAPTAEAYTGPVLFEPTAAAQLFAQVLGDNLRVQRRPVTEAGRAVNIIPSEFEARLGARVLPDTFDVTDDSTQKTYNGKPLAGFYEFDIEGVEPKPVSIVEKGIFKSFLTTRQPIRGFLASNGHARLPGNYGAKSAAIGNLFVKSSNGKPLAALKTQLIQMITASNKPYGLLIRKLDYPFAGGTGEYQALAQANAQGGGGARPVSPPLMVYKVYPDGREELVRGLRFRAFSSRTLRDILATSQETATFDFVNTASPLALLGSGGYLAAASVVAPGLLFEELEFDTPREQLAKPPTVPPPPLQ